MPAAGSIASLSWNILNFCDLCIFSFSLRCWLVLDAIFWYFWLLQEVFYHISCNYIQLISVSLRSMRLVSVFCCISATARLPLQNWKSQFRSMFSAWSCNVPILMQSWILVSDLETLFCSLLSIEKSCIWSCFCLIWSSHNCLWLFSSMILSF